MPESVILNYPILFNFVFSKAVEEICPNIYQQLTILTVEQGVETCTENTGLDVECRLFLIYFNQ
jgi:hypothetical protein